jgi:hypothetical protein
MHRVLQTVKHFGVRTMVCINKADIYPAGADEIEAFCRESGIETVGRIPFDLAVARAMVAGEAVTAFRPEAASSVAIIAMCAIEFFEQFGIKAATGATQFVRHWKMKEAAPCVEHEGTDTDKQALRLSQSPLRVHSNACDIQQATCE